MAADTPVALVALYRGSEGRRRVFDVLVDGTPIATETLPYHPTEWLERTYPIPEALTRGKQRVTVRFQPAADALTASVFEVRVVDLRQPASGMSHLFKTAVRRCPYDRSSCTQ